MAILAIESTRAGAFVIGEDLGTVEAQVHAAMAEFGIAGTKVLWFEDDSPALWPEDSLATITTHDLPTLAMVYARADEPVADDPMLPRLLRVIGDAGSVKAAAAAAHEALLSAPSRLRLLTTDDLAGATRQANLPGLNDYPSWRIRLPLPVTQLPL